VNTTPPSQNGGRLRLLVTIASFGDKNLGLLKKVIQDYRNMPMDVDVVVLSNNPRDLGEGVKVLVGLPTEDPWSLPFAHKPVLAENADRYDLFIYTEDDMAVTERNLQAFLAATPHLAPTEIAGFLRYEVDPAGGWSFPDAHGSYHWKLETVERRGGYTIAEFNNEHAAFFILTQSQLKQAIASGGFLRSPCKGRYDLACTAATDPYTNCGFRKVVCISALDDFLIHHMSNRYVGKLGPSLSVFKEQVAALMNIRNNGHRTEVLCPTEARVLPGNWSKQYYEQPRGDVLDLVPADAKTVLSIGCGWGATEARLKERGAAVTALALDPVIGAAAALPGIEVIHGTLSEGLETLAKRKFDCVLVTNLLHFQSDPKAVVSSCCRLVRDGGALVMSGPNFDRIPVFVKRTVGIGDYRKLRVFDEGGISVCGPGTLTGSIKRAGLQIAAVRWVNDPPVIPNGAAISPPRLGPLTARSWVLQARR
jgi:2-polyprenyl-3-methyl-5-hydroxy-6-metoxy-1,4-benzoquinol methylase